VAIDPGGGSNVRIYSNTIYNVGMGIRGGGASIKNNIFANVGNPGAGTSGNNLTADPKFVNPANGDFHLQPGSPAIDKGTSLPEVPCDFDGKKRPAGSGYDIGALEQGASPGGNCQGGGGSTPPPSGQGCHLFTPQTPPSSIPSGFAVPWDVFSPAKDLLLKISCEGSSATVNAGAGNAIHYVWPEAYVSNAGGAWEKITLTGTQATPSSPG
jgi:hypothetical protein